ncbi:MULTISPECIES: hypothetical protein [unclassified Micromonospora]|uniref:hypothetical protein n=1 Tax=unclassified Micromonospora TaxID=2617518 RepID=UPI0022BF5B18|nr:hypothetical protein [Micromonospora sp. AKA38]GHJ15356.1 hypothetical protein TPA0908_33510 [Micromonospora sp. AKA38]
MAGEYTEAAAKLSIAETTLWHWAFKGRIFCHRVDRLVCFTDEDLDRALQGIPRPGRRR